MDSGTGKRSNFLFTISRIPSQFSLASGPAVDESNGDTENRQADAAEQNFTGALPFVTSISLRFNHLCMGPEIQRLTTPGT